MNFLTKLVSWVPFNRGKPKVQAGGLLIVALILCGMATQCRAESYAQFGAGSTVVRGQTTALNLSVVYPDAGPGDAAYEAGVMFVGDSYLNGIQRQNFAWYGALVEGFGKFDVGIGPAYLQNTDTYNGSHLNFTLLLGYRFERIPITVRMQHFSNGGTQSPNKGRDFLLVFWRF
jgi:hypothetical protein